MWSHTRDPHLGEVCNKPGVWNNFSSIDKLKWFNKGTKLVEVVALVGDHLLLSDSTEV